MSLPTPKVHDPRSNVLAAVYVLIVLIMANLSALVDFFLHPDISYFDEEHLIVGAVSALVSGALIFLINRELIALRKALGKVLSLESILPICSFCKKIREPEADPRDRDAWHPIEEYISERTRSEFTHGICPDCMSKFFPTDAPKR